MSVGKPVKIAVVIPKYGLVGGGERFAAELTERLAKSSSLEIHVFANQWQQHSNLVRFHKVPILSFPKYLTPISFARFAQRQIRKFGADLIHAHERVFAADLVSLHSVPHRFWVRDIRRKPFLSLFDRSTIWVEKCMVRNENRTIFLPVSGITQEKFTAEYPHVSDRVEVLHPGVDAGRFNQLDRNQCRELIRKQFGFHETDTILLFVGMNFELKGLTQLLAAMARIQLSTHRAGLKLLVVGKGNERKYRKMAREAGLGDHIRFAGVVKEHIEVIYRASDIFCMLSTFDTFGMTVLEAMAASLPVIISPNVGAKDLVQEGVNGFITDRDDLDAISRRILCLLDHRERTRMGTNAVQVAQEHTWDRMVDKVMGFYEKLLSRK